MTFYRVCRWIVRQIARSVFGVTVHGAHHVPAHGPAILAVNHVSALDPFVVGSALRRPLWFMAKEELFRPRALGAVFRGLHAFPVRRDRADLSTIKRTLTLLREGQAVMMFPEGTRQDGVTFGPVRPGVAVLAARAGVPVVPAYHEGIGRILPRGAGWPRRHPVTVCFGPPIQPSPAVLSDPAAAVAFGEHLRAQWSLLRSWAARGESALFPARGGDPAPTPREEVPSV